MGDNRNYCTCFRLSIASILPSGFGAISSSSVLIRSVDFFLAMSEKRSRERESYCDGESYLASYCDCDLACLASKTTDLLASRESSSSKRLCLGATCALEDEAGCGAALDWSLVDLKAKQQYRRDCTSEQFIDTS